MYTKPKDSSVYRSKGFNIATKLCSINVWQQDANAVKRIF